jgi:tetratricopeptide (TPR) repeat protein
MKTRPTTHLPLLALLCCAALPALAAPPADPLAALAEGNRQAEAGRLDQAAAAYLAGYDPAAIHPTLAYNLGSTLHQLGRLPEAILWYRRAAPAGKAGADPWLEDNLLLARRTLGSQNAGHPDAWAELRRQAGFLTGAAILLSWLAAAIFLLAPRRRGLAVAGFAAAILLAAAAWLSHGRGAREAVLLADCTTGAGSLPAGSELWVARDGADFRVAGSRDATCPAAAVALVHPD